MPRCPCTLALGTVLLSSDYILLATCGRDPALCILGHDFNRPGFIVRRLVITESSAEIIMETLSGRWPVIYHFQYPLANPSHSHLPSCKNSQWRRCWTHPSGRGGVLSCLGVKGTKQTPVQWRLSWISKTSLPYYKTITFQWSIFLKT